MKATHSSEGNLLASADGLRQSRAIRVHPELPARQAQPQRESVAFELRPMVLDDVSDEAHEVERIGVELQETGRRARHVGSWSTSAVRWLSCRAIISLIVVTWSGLAVGLARTSRPVRRGAKRHRARGARVHAETTEGRVT